MIPGKNGKPLGRTVRTAGIVLGISLLSFLLSTSLFNTAELFARDVLFHLRGSVDDPAPVVLVAIDDASFDQNQLQWPWPRDYIAQIVDNIAAGDPTVIVLDIIFNEAAEPEEDAALARALGDAGNVILVNSITTETRSGFMITQLNHPIPEFEEVSTLGLTNFPRDEDGKVRRLLAFQSHNEQLYFSWSLQAARMHLGEDTFHVLSRDEVLIGDHPVKLDDQYLLVNYRSAPFESIQYYSAYQVAEEFVDSSVFAGKIVILGATSETLHDNYVVPLSSNPPMPGAEINAHAIDTILSQRYISSLGLGIQFAIALLAAFVGVSLTLDDRPLVSLAVLGALVIVYLLVVYLFFSLLGIWLPVVGPLLAVILTFVVNISLQVYEEQRRRARVRGLFERYVSPAAIDQMLNQTDASALTGQRREMSILFSDIRGFTTLSEQLKPEQVVEILNEYLGEMTKIIFKHEGTIDKFEGDAILAVWNAPLDVEDHPTKAVRCAIAMAQKLTEMQKTWKTTGHVVLRNGIGVTTGPCFVGNIGSAQRMDYTVIGDVVNLSARLEALTKELGHQILFSRATAEQLSEDIKTEFVTSAQVKGRVRSVDVFTVDAAAYNLSSDAPPLEAAIPDKSHKSKES